MVVVTDSRLRFVKPGTKSYVSVNGAQAVFTCDFFEALAVRRQIIWDSLRRKLAECRPHPGG